MPNEIWKDIPGCNGRYQASNLGRVRSMPKYNLSEPRVLRPTVNKRDGRESVMLCLEEGGVHKRITVHRLVALSHVPNQDPDRLTEVNHKDENPRNNRAENLEWCDHSYNMHYGTLPDRVAAHNRSRRRPVESVENGTIKKTLRLLTRC